MKVKVSALCIFGAVALALIAAPAVRAADLKYPVPCYQGDELKKLQDKVTAQARDMSVQ